MPMKTIEEQLSPESFIRIHKSYIVSIAFITSVRKSSVFIDSLELPVSDNYRDAIAVLTGKL
jgi:two-component system LytT family response regulator